MTAVVSRERARATYLTGAAGMLMLAVATVMMMVAAPAQGPVRAHGLAQPSAVRLTTDVPSMISESWSTSSSARVVRPPLARSAVS